MAIPATPRKPRLPGQAVPAPVTPENLQHRTGGYVGPHPTVQPQASLPAQATPAPGPVRTGRQPAAQAPTTPGAGGLGVSDEAFRGVLADMSSAPNPQEFATQFGALMEQRELLGTPTGTDDKGFQVPSKEQTGYIKKFINQAVQQMSAPEQVGGRGMPAASARLYAVAEARKRWPEIDPKVMSTLGAPGEKGLMPRPSAVNLGSDQGWVEVGPQRAAKLTPDKIAGILSSPQLKSALEWARAYKEQVGATANAADYAKYVISDQVASMTTARQTALAQMGALEKQVADGTATPEVHAELDQYQTALASIPDTDKGILQAAQDLLVKDVHTLSVAAALAQLY